MTVIVLVAAPPGLRGHLTRWMVEVHAGVFVGTVPKRVRDRLWNVISERIRDGQAVLVEPASTEQGWSVRTAGRERWTPISFDGLMLVERERRKKP